MTIPTLSSSLITADPPPLLSSHQSCRLLHYSAAPSSIFWHVAANGSSPPDHVCNLASSHCKPAVRPSIRSSHVLKCSRVTTSSDTADDAVEAARPSVPYIFILLDGFHKTINNSGEVIMIAFWLMTIWMRTNNHLSCNVELWGIVGAILNHILSKWLKYILKQPRPGRISSSDPKNLGMPSSHAQSLAFMGAYSFLGGLFATLSWDVGDCFKLGILTILLLYMAWLRVREGCHTFMQVFVGAFFGASFGTLWFSWYDAVVM